MTSSSTFKVNGVSNTIFLGAALDGTSLGTGGKMCMGAKEVTPPDSCEGDEFLEASTGKCLKCSTACSACTGPSVFDCTGDCKLGEKDSRGACSISAVQVISSG